MLLCLCKAFVFITFTAHTFSNLSWSVPFSLCHSREAEDILKNFGRCHSSRPSPPPLLFLRLPATPPLVNRCKQKMQVALLSPVFFSKTSFGLHLDDPVMKTFGFFPHGKKLFLFLKHQSSLNKTTVLSQESNNNFLYIWQTGFCIFFSSYFTIPSQLYFLEPEPLWLCLCQFLL